MAKLDDSGLKQPPPCDNGDGRPALWLVKAAGAGVAGLGMARYKLCTPCAKRMRRTAVSSRPLRSDEY